MDLNGKFKNIYTEASGIRKYIFSWIYPLIEIGKQRALLQTDIPLIHVEDGTQWNFCNIKKDLQFSDRTQNMRPFFRMIWKNFKFQILVILILQLIISAILSLNPIVINSIVQLFQNERPDYSLFAQTFIYFFVYHIVLMLIVPAYSFLIKQQQIKVNGALKGLVIDKTLADMQNLLMIDIPQITELFNSYVNLMILPIQLSLRIYVYFVMMGESAIVGMVGLFFQFICNLIYARIYAKKQANIMNFKDARMRSINELVHGINTIKQNGYYNFFSIRIAKRRYDEMNNIRDQKLLTLLISFMSGCLFPVGVIYITFRMYEILDLANIIAIQLNYFSLVEIISNIPHIISSVLVGGISVKRIMNFFHLKENSELIIDTINIPENIAIFVKNGTFAWNKSIQSLINTDSEDTNNSFMLKNISLEIFKGEVILILGRTGSGKTSLMYAMLGELQEQNMNKFQINGSISIAEQEPLLVQESILYNIIQHEIFDQERLMQILDTTQLIDELQSMKCGINTEIGENGSMLSGGQRRRIDLSRALYQNKDIYFLDSPLTSLDPLISEQMAQNIIASMRGKTLIIFSNSLQFWNQVDKVFVLEDGKIVKQGTFDELIQKNNIKTHKNLNSLIKSNKILNQVSIGKYQSINKMPKNIIEAEDRQTGNIPIHLFKTLYILFGGWPILLICTLLSFCGMSIGLYYQSYLSKISDIADDESTTEEQKSETANQYLFLFPLLYTGKYIIQLSRDLILILHGVKASLVLHEKIINNLLRASVQKFYKVTLASRIKNRLSSDLHNFDIRMGDNISTLFDGFFKMVSLFIASFFFSTAYTYPEQIIFIFLVIYISRIYLKSIVELFRLEALSKSPMLNHFHEVVKGVVYFRHCSNTDHIKQKFFDIVDIQLRNMVAGNALQQWYHQTTNLLFIFIYTSVLIVNVQIFSIIIQYYDVNLNKQQASLALYISISLAQSIFSFISDIQSTYSQMIFFQRCDFLVNKINSDDDDGIQQGYIQYNDSLNENLKLEKRYDHASAIQVTNLMAKYFKDSSPVLNNVSFSILPGEKIAIIGRAGSGKTSLIQCITKILEYQSGTISCHDIGYEQLSTENIRSNFSVITQDPFVFEGTVLQNIDPSGLYSNGADVLRFIGESFSQNITMLSDLQAQVGELGKNISYGERQLIVILRVMLQKRNIVILDECTGSLDQKYYILIKNMLRHYLKDKTVIEVTHQLDSTGNFDRVILMENGCIRSIGKVEEVLKQYIQ